MFAYFRVPVPWRELARRTVLDTLEDGCAGLAAQLAFYFVLGLFPALLVLVSLLSYLPVDAALGTVIGRLEGLMPEQVLDLIHREVDRMLDGGGAGLLTFALAGAIWSSSTAMTAVISTLNHAYDIEEWRPWWKSRLTAVVLTVALALFVVIAFALVVGGAELGRWIAQWIGAGDIFENVWRFARWPVALALVVVAVDLVYHFAPNAESEWVWVTPGALLATVLWLLASLGFRLYLHYVGDIGAVYGTIGSLIVLMLWFYLSAFALLVGAELNAEIDKALPTRDTGPQGPTRRKKIGPAAEKQGSPESPLPKRGKLRHPGIGGNG